MQSQSIILTLGNSFYEYCIQMKWSVELGYMNIKYEK